ncbi:MAG: OmpA family protein [Candidatus Poribacteria bacterium]|nr:OmpA family protein [Candidatus Poribacteria bacterium]
MKTRGTLSVAALLVISIAVIGCGKLDQEEFEMWKNEHVAEVNQSNTEIKANLTKLEGKVDQNNKDTMEAISRAKDEAIAASQQGDADNIAAARQNTKEEIAKARADLTKDINSQSKETLDSAKAEDAKAQKAITDLANSLKAQGMDLKKVMAQVASILEDVAALKADAASEPTLLVTVNFSSGQTGLSSKAKEMLDGIVGQILENPEAAILVEGHADGTPVLRGGHRSNWDLSQSRANSVVKYLKGKGIDAERITAVGKAHTDPVAPQNTSAGRAMNRRVEVILNPSGAM